MKGGPFKLNLYPREYFNTNPYHDEGPLPPPKKQPEKVPIPHPFKPSSPAKKVCLLIVRLLKKFLLFTFTDIFF